MVQPIHDLETLRRLLDRSQPAPQSYERARASTGVTELDAILAGGFPRGVVSAVRGASGTGRMSIAGLLLAHETRQGRAVAWVDGSGTLYPPALMAFGICAERLLIVRPDRNRIERAFLAMQAIIESQVFSSVVGCGLDAGLTRARARRLQTATEGTQVCALCILEPESDGFGAGFRLSTRRKQDRIVVQLEKDGSKAMARSVSLDPELGAKPIS